MGKLKRFFKSRAYFLMVSSLSPTFQVPWGIQSSPGASWLRGSHRRPSPWVCFACFAGLGLVLNYPRFLPHLVTTLPMNFVTCHSSELKSLRTRTTLTEAFQADSGHLDGIFREISPCDYGSWAPRLLLWGPRRDSRTPLPSPQLLRLRPRKYSGSSRCSPATI